MAIQDPDAERRNLVVCSLLFIIYFYAGGSFTDAVVRLQVVNITLSRPFVLSIIAWVAFAWCTYRYWLTHNGVFQRGFRSDFNTWRNKKYLVEFIDSKVEGGLIQDKDKGYHLEGIFWEKWSVVAQLIYASNVQRGEDGKIMSYSMHPDAESHLKIRFSGFRGWLLALRATFSCCINKRSFSDYLAPYILVVTAILGAAYNFLLG